MPITRTNDFFLDDFKGQKQDERRQRFYLFFFLVFFSEIQFMQHHEGFTNIDDE